MPTYKEKLLDPRWQKKRLEILQRDDFACQMCNSKENTLHVHHKLYISGKDPWDYDNNLLTTLCLNCHEVEKDEMQEQLDELKSFMKIMVLSDGVRILNCCMVDILRQNEFYDRDIKMLLESLEYFLSNDANIDSMVIDYEKHIKENQNG